MSDIRAQDEMALASVKAIYDAAEQAQADAARAQTAADTAQESADEAKESADSATTSALAARYNLSEVEKVVDAINWISQHGEYELTADTEVVEGKWYYELQSGSYVQVNPQEGADPHALGLYELSDVDTSISNYVASHISLDNNGLVIQTDGVRSKVRISGNGVQLTNEAGKAIATFSETVTLGDSQGMHVTLSAGDSSATPVVLPELGFWQGTTKVAYINSNTLYIKQARIEEILRIGKFVWKVQSANRISLVYAPS